jgi:hypothetical protein
MVQFPNLILLQDLDDDSASTVPRSGVAGKLINSSSKQAVGQITFKWMSLYATTGFNKTTQKSDAPG